MKAPQIAFWLDVAPSLVESVISGPTKLRLFQLNDAEEVEFSTRSFKDFLLDADRAGEYSIESIKPDTLFKETLS